MKIFRILILAAWMGGMAFLPTAHAAYFSVTPAGSYDALSTPLSSIGYFVFFNLEAGENYSFISWDIGMEYDTSELGDWSANYVFGGTIEETSPGMLENIHLSPTPSTDVTFASEGSYLMAWLIFDILNPIQPFDGQPDFSVVSQVGDLFFGFGTSDFQILQFEGAAGADVGSPVPIPGAVWLLGSGLLGLIGLKRKKKGS